MPDVNNEEYLKLARLDFKRCQAQHQIELGYMQKWYENCNVEEFGISRKDLILAYFLGAATAFEPERARERIMWAKTQLISRMIKAFFIEESVCPLEQNSVMLKEFRNNINKLHKFTKSEHGAVNILLEAIHDLLREYDECISNQLRDAWYLWVMKYDGEDETNEAEILITTLNICAAQISQNDDMLLNHDYITISKLAFSICHRLSEISNKKVAEMRMQGQNMTKESMDEINKDMQTLTKLVVEEACTLHKNTRQTFLAFAKTYYYRAYFDVDTIDLHIFKVLFEPVV